MTERVLRIHLRDGADQRISCNLTGIDSHRTNGLAEHFLLTSPFDLLIHEYYKIFSGATT